MSLTVVLAIACPPSAAAGCYIVWLRRRLAAATWESTHDPLTGLLNRRLLPSTLADLDDRGTPFVLVICDVNRFKQINDQYGHDAGDAVLVELAHRLTRLDVDAGADVAAVFRLGGDEFALVINTHVDLAKSIVLTIWHAVARTVFTLPDGQQIPVRVSVGVASRRPGISSAVLLRWADTMMLRAKPAGGIIDHPTDPPPRAVRVWPRPRYRPRDSQPAPDPHTVAAWTCWFHAADLMPLARHSASSRWHYRNGTEEALIRDCPGGLSIWSHSGGVAAGSTGYPPPLRHPGDPDSVIYAPAVHTQTPPATTSGPQVAHMHLDAHAVDAIGHAASWSGLIAFTVTGDHATFTLTRPGLHPSPAIGRP